MHLNHLACLQYHTFARTGQRAPVSPFGNRRLNTEPIAGMLWFDSEVSSIAALGFSTLRARTEKNGASLSSEDLRHFHVMPGLAVYMLTSLFAKRLAVLIASSGVPR